jgi:hypothetical protein
MSRGYNPLSTEDWNKLMRSNVVARVFPKGMAVPGLGGQEFIQPSPTPTQTLGVCEIWDLNGASPGITTFTYTDCNGVQQIQLVNYNDTISACVKGGQVSWNNAGLALNTFVPCVSITPTPTPTPSITPTQTITPTPTITPTSTLTPTPTPI